MQGSLYMTFGKRLFDFIASLTGILILSPVFILISLIIILTDGLPVFYKHKRIGRNFKTFYVLKFRSMVKDADKKGLQITSADDPRITKIGKLLRKSKLDELPQLINVLKGDMSLVGPRPEVDKYVNIFKNDYREILKVRPGITDISSIIYRDEESVLRDKPDPEEYYKNILLPQKIQLAKEYFKYHSFLLDLKLILATIMKIIYPNFNLNLPAPPHSSDNLRNEHE